MNKDIGSEKKTLRKKIRELERNLPEDYKAKADEKIFINLMKLDEYKNARTVLAFYGTNTEINTVPFLENVLLDGKTLLLPKCIDSTKMEAKQVYSLSELEIGMYGIMEPKIERKTIVPDEIDFVLVPCLSCNTKGERLGHGAGYYDRYLTDYHGTAVMVCRKALMSEYIPVDENDRAISIVMHE